MLLSPYFTNIQSQALNEFNRSRLRALGDSWIAKILRRDNSPKQFADTDLDRAQNKRYTGIQNIQVDRIIGTLGREVDFDQNFRPLNKHLSQRWINAWLRLNTDSWQPIIVHKVGKFYFVEDGHHRISVAQAVGMVFIEAEVWDHSLCQIRQEPCPCTRALPRTIREVSCVNS